jgi:hypothetical protein
MSRARAALMTGLTTAVLAIVVFCARAHALPVKVGQVQVKQIMAIGCDIRVTAEGEAIRIEAVASSREDVNGRYRLDVAKTSASGTSRNVQSGEFSLEADREQVLSTTFLGASDAGHFQARLVIDSNSGSVSCVSP